MGRGASGPRPNRLTVALVAVLGLLLTGIAARAAKDEFERETSIVLNAFLTQAELAVRHELSQHHEKLEGWRDALELISGRYRPDLARLFRSHARSRTLPGIREVVVVGSTGSDAMQTGRIADAALFLRTAQPLTSEANTALLAPREAGLAFDSRHVLVLPIRTPSGTPKDPMRVSGWLAVGLDFDAMLKAAVAGTVPVGLSVSLQDVFGRSMGRLVADAGSEGPAASFRQINRRVDFGGRPVDLAVRTTPGIPLADVVDWTWTVVAAGMTLTLLLSWSVHAVLVRRRQQLERNRQLQLSARDSEQRFQDIVESSRDWVWEVDVDGTYTYSSPSSERLFGYPPERIIGTKGQFLWLNEVEDPPGSAGRGRLRTFKHLSGAAITLESHSVQIVSDEGKVLGFRGFDRDVSQRVQLETELHTLQARLLKAIQAESAGQSLMGLAHEINQPLAAIAAYNQACLRMAEAGSEVTEDMRAAIRATAENAVLAGDIIRKFRSAVAEAGVDREAMAPGRVIQDAVEIARARLRSEGIRISVDAGAKLPEVLGDATLIKQLVLNLVGNAIDAMTGQPVRELVIRARESPPDKVWVEIMDTGTGVREQFRDKIFEPYFTTKADGLGMGLAICKSIIEAHGESIDFKSRPEGGTSFRFSLGTKDH